MNKKQKLMMYELGFTNVNPLEEKLEINEERLEPSINKRLTGYFTKDMETLISEYVNKAISGEPTRFTDFGGLKKWNFAGFPIKERSELALSLIYESMNQINSSKKHSLKEICNDTNHPILTMFSETYIHSTNENEFIEKIFEKDWLKNFWTNNGAYTKLYPMYRTKIYLDLLLKKPELLTKIDTPSFTYPHLLSLDKKKKRTKKDLEKDIANFIIDLYPDHLVETLSNSNPYIGLYASCEFDSEKPLLKDIHYIPHYWKKKKGVKEIIQTWKNDYQLKGLAYQVMAEIIKTSRNFCNKEKKDVRKLNRFNITKKQYRAIATMLSNYGTNQYIKAFQNSGLVSKNLFIPKIMNVHAKVEENKLIVKNKFYNSTSIFSKESTMLNSTKNLPTVIRKLYDFYNAAKELNQEENYEENKK